MAKNTKYVRRGGPDRAIPEGAALAGVLQMPLGFIDAMAETIRVNIRAERVRAGLTQAELGWAVGVSHQQIAKYESGRDRISAALLFCIAAALKVPVTRFFRP